MLCLQLASVLEISSSRIHALVARFNYPTHTAKAAEVTALDMLGVPAPTNGSLVFVSVKTACRLLVDLQHADAACLADQIRQGAVSRPPPSPLPYDSQPPYPPPPPSPPSSPSSSPPSSPAWPVRPAKQPPPLRSAQLTPGVPQPVAPRVIAAATAAPPTSVNPSTAFSRLPSTVPEVELTHQEATEVYGINVNDLTKPARDFVFEFVSWSTDDIRGDRGG